MLRVFRPGDNKWIHVQKGWYTIIHDVTYYNRLVYTYDGTCNIKACDVYGEHPMVLVNVTRLPAHLYDRKQDVAGAYIIGLDDDERKTLLVVLRHGMYGQIEDEFTTYSGVIKSNSIYYTDDVRSLHHSGGRDMGIYSLSEKTIEPHFTGESRRGYGLTPPIWIQ
ncbi:hypothetical protein Tco_1043958 [Tanacetum coccineum]|uniref:DUF295 domain-containing protein n=1 Tax=Tanacetum coccineum TaxID=301880 RepID=A0ABQ5GNJ9_9ASTR